MTPEEIRTQAEDVLAQAKAALEAAKTVEATAKTALEAAGKTKEEAEKQRLDNQLELRTMQTSVQLKSEELAKSQLANETSRLDNAKKELDNRFDELTKLTSAGKELVPNLSSVDKNSVTFATGDVLRQAELAARALDRAAHDAAAVISIRAAGRTVVITSATNLRRDVAQAVLLAAEAGQHLSLLEELTTTVDTALAAAPAAPGSVAPSFLDPATAGLAIGSVAASAVTELAKVLSYDVAVTAQTATLPALTIHAALIPRLELLTPAHQELGWSDGTSGLAKTLADLRQIVVRLAPKRGVLDWAADQAKALDDQIATLTKGIAAATGDEKVELEAQLALARTHRATFDGRLDIKQRVDAAVKAYEGFLASAVTAAADGTTALGRALAAEPLLTAGTCALVVPDGAVHAHQLLVTRRIRAPRLQVAVSVEFTWFLTDGTHVLAAGRPSAAVTEYAMFKPEQAYWERTPLP
jgi:hypothetical protein